MVEIIPLLLAGGSGTRLWPLSRKSYPKQFSKLVGEESLFQKSANRLTSSDDIKFAPHITLTSDEYRFIVAEQLQMAGINPGPILIEPSSKNTAPAILAAAIFADQKNPNQILLAAPSDHIIPETKAFHRAVQKGFDAVKSGNIVTFGIKPTHPETGYGYLESRQTVSDKPFPVASFREKPNKKDAETLFKSGRHLWNAGIFMFTAKDMIEAFKKFAPEMFSPVNRSVQNGHSDLGFFRFEPTSWSLCKEISIDYAVLEHADNLVAIPCDHKWSDLGDWEAVWNATQKDECGLALSENAYAIECKNSLLRSEASSQKVVGLGLEEIVVIAMPDAVLVADKSRAQEIKTVVQRLKIEGAGQAEIFPKDHRPWGWFESLSISDKFQVKRIKVNPGAALSLQSHKYRSEHWVVVEGSAKVTINENTKLLSTGESIYVPLGAVHRLENPELKPLVIIEIQTGSYFGEDDIIRYSDIYNRDLNQNHEK